MAVTIATLAISATFVSSVYYNYAINCTINCSANYTINYTANQATTKQPTTSYQPNHTD